MFPSCVSVDTGGGEPLDCLAPLSGAAVVGEFLFEELSVAVAVAVERPVAFQEGLNFVLCQTVLFVRGHF